MSARMNYYLDELNYQTYLLLHARRQNKGAIGIDSEMKKTYRAEWAFVEKFEVPKFASIEEAQRFAKRIYKSKTWINLWTKSVESDVGLVLNPQPKVVQMNTRCKKNAGITDGRTVSLSLDTGLDKYTLLHELAHCLGHMHHGRSFRQCLLTLVGTFMGSEAKKLLTAEFKERKLAFGNARRPLSKEKWIESKKRMEKIRNV